MHAITRDADDDSYGVPFVSKLENYHDIINKS